MKRYLYLVLIFVAVNVNAASKPAKAKPVLHAAATIKNDTSAVNVRYFNKKALNEFSKKPEFKYREADNEPSLWTRFWRWFWHLFDFMNFKVSKNVSFWTLTLRFLEYAIVVLGLGAIVFIILKLTGIDVFNIFRRKSSLIDLPYSESAENIHEIDFDKQIEAAISQHNYRLAVRLLYLKCLKQLSDAALIHWQPEKTNSAYLEELGNTSKYSSFKLLTRQFEYVWYGDFPIDSNVFSQINLMFQKFKKEGI
jgi:hypothetical protein